MKLRQNDTFLSAVLRVGLSIRQVLLGFVALYPTYILPVLLPNTKPNIGLAAV
jgi:hypothetical protein